VLGDGGASGRRLVPPPWVRTRVLQPETLEECPEGTVGLLCHLDLANVGSVAAVLTEDIGVRVGDGFVLSGRAPGSDARGCSLVMEEIMRAGAR
jgi:Acyl-protein synthetase, LuxE